MRRDILTHVQGKVVYYKPDGTGRDTYIKHDNGGLLSHDAVHSLKPKPEKTKDRMYFGKVYQRNFPPKVENKFSHYISDGSGRDFYVTHNEGGNSNVYSWRNQVDFKFNHELRDYQKIHDMNPQKIDINGTTQSKMTKSQNFRNRAFSQHQFNESIRLSKPKQIKKPPPIETYFGNSYSSSKMKMSDKI